MDSARILVGCARPIARMQRTKGHRSALDLVMLGDKVQLAGLLARKEGITIGTRSKEGIAALELACMHSKQEAVKELMAHGAVWTERAQTCQRLHARGILWGSAPARR